MRRINNGEGEILIFKSEAEREDYFREGDRRVNESQKKSLSDLHAAYMSNISKASQIRPVKGKKDAKIVFDAINRSYRLEVQKVYDAHARARGNLRAAKDKSVIESQLIGAPAA